MAAQYVCTLRDLRKTFPGGREVLKGIFLSFLPGAKIGVLGPNGMGKSTLMRIIAGQDRDFSGDVLMDSNLKVGYLPQEPQLDPQKTVYETALDGLAAVKKDLDAFNALSARFAEPMEEDEMNDLLNEQAALQERIDAAGGWEIDRKISIALDALRCPDDNAVVRDLSGGEKRRVALCHLLLSEPDVLLLDEPTNHLDAESIAWLEQFLEKYPGTVICITHDRYFLDHVAQWILEIDRGQAFPFEGNYSAWLDHKEKRLALEAKEEASRSRVLEKELDWIRQTPKARQAKSKARVSAYESLLKEHNEARNVTNSIIIPPGGRLGSLVLKAEGLSKSFEGKLLFENLSFDIPPGALVGIIGPNGAGKSTLFRLIIGGQTPDSGTLKVGETVKLGYVDQQRDALAENKTVWEEIAESRDVLLLGKREIHSRTYVAGFNFKGADQQKKVGQLSGGERNRVHLAKMLKSGANLLLLDEPTNDLDVETLRSLETALLEFAGCGLVISHDRWFLDRIATHIMAFEGNSAVVFREGNYQDYIEDYKRRFGETYNPHRIKYKPPTR